MEKTMSAAKGAPDEKLYQDLLNLLSGIVHRDESDEGNLSDVKNWLLPKAFGKYFASNEYASRPSPRIKEIEFHQYDGLMFNLSKLIEFVEKRGKAVMQEWEKIDESYFRSHPDSDDWSR